MDIVEFYNKDEPLDSYMRLCSYVLSCSVEDRAKIKSQYDDGLGWECPSNIIPAKRESYSSETRTEAKYSSVERAEACLVGHWLFNGSYDFRDVLVGWSAIYNGLLVAGEEPREIFKRVGLVLGGEAGDEIIDFSNRKSSNLDMKAFGLRYVRDLDGEIVKIERAW